MKNLQQVNDALNHLTKTLTAGVKESSEANMALAQSALELVQKLAKSTDEELEKIRSRLDALERRAG